MVQRWGAVLFLLVAFAGCRKTRLPETNNLWATSQPEQHQQTEAITVEEALRIQRAAVEERNRAEQSRNAVQAGETAKREKTQEVAHEQRHATQALRVRRHRWQRQNSAGKALAVHRETGTPGAASTTAHVTLHFQNDAGHTFRLVDARFLMDGADLPMVINSAERGKSYIVFSGKLPFGRHTVAAHLTHQGANHGVFSYMNGYTFKVKSDELLTVRGDQPVSFSIICKERTGFNDAVERRLVVTVEGRHAI